MIPLDVPVSLAILLIGWWIVNYWAKKAERDKAKKRRYPSALDETERKISE